MKLSIIIPIYNVEKYIVDCLESLICQKNPNVEFVLVDDGSKDNSVDLAKPYLEKDSRFKLLHKTNGGLSDARNYGVSHCDGDYVFFLDSDDTIDLGMLDAVMECLNKDQPDLLVFDMLFVWENSDQTKVVRAFDKTVNDSVQSLLLSTPSACNKIMKRSKALEYPFPYGMFYEDLATIPMMYIDANKVIYHNQTYYHYRQREGSIIYTFNKKTLDVFKCFERIYQHYQKEGKFDKYSQELEYMAIEHLMLYANRRFINAPDASEYLKVSKNFIASWFPKWKNNQYIKRLSINDRLFIYVAATGSAPLLKGMLRLKHLLKGGA